MSAPSASLLGYVDRLEPTAIIGWAHDPDQPNKPVTVTLYIGGKYVSTIKADAFRPDLQAAGMGDGRKVFHFHLGGILTATPQAVRVVFARTGETIPNGRATLARDALATPENYDALLDERAWKRPVADRLAAHPESSWPLISIVVPVYNPPLRSIERAVQSVLLQQYPHWELLLVDDASPDPAIPAWLKQWDGTDPRIRVRLETTNRGISGATNLGIHDARGEFIALLDHDDELTPDALAEVACVLLGNPATDVVYTDQDKIDEQDQRFEPFHKPVWSPVFFLGVMYVGHLLVARTTLVRAIGGCDARFNKVQDFDLMLRLSERTDAIAHIPRILYHWRTLPGSLASSSHAKDSISELQVGVVRAHLQRRGIALAAEPHPRLPHRVALHPVPRTRFPRVSILMPSACKLAYAPKCIDTLLNTSTYPNLELVLVVNEIRWQVPEQAAFLATLAADRRVRIIRYRDQPYNFSLYNNWAAREATGEILALCNDDIEVVTPDWVERLLAHLEIPGVAATGPLLTYPNGQVQHAGVALGFRGTADHVMRHFPSDSDGYNGSLSCSRENTALTAACLMVRKSDYWGVGGMREVLATIYNDVDFCLRLRRQVGSLVYVPNAHLIHHESVTRGSFYDLLERALFVDAYGPDIAAGDPYYNRNFTRNSPDYRPRHS